MTGDAVEILSKSSGLPEQNKPRLDVYPYNTYCEFKIDIIRESFFFLNT